MDFKKYLPKDVSWFRLPEYIKDLEKASLKVVERTFTPEEIFSLGTAPIELLPAPGPGKAYNIISLHGKVLFNSVAYDELQIGIKYPSAELFVGTLPGVNVQTTSILSGTLITAGIGNIIIENEPLELVEINNAPTVGDSPLYFYMTYGIITVPVGGNVVVPNNDVIGDFTITDEGNGWGVQGAALNTVLSSTTLTGTGSGATFRFDDYGTPGGTYNLANLSIVNRGNGYEVGDTLLITSGATSATITVTEALPISNIVNGVATASLVDAGSDWFIINRTYKGTTLTGNGKGVTITVDSNTGEAPFSISTFSIEQAGYGYQVGDTFTIDDPDSATTTATFEVTSII